MEDKDEPPSAKALDEGYNQTYLVMTDSECKSDEGHEVFFRCGNWCYKGQVQFNGVKINTEELPILIPTLQRQQGSLRYFCNSKSIPAESDYHMPLKLLEDAAEFIAQELVSEGVDKELRKMSSLFPWIDDDKSATYFELAMGNVPEYMKARVIYFVVQNGEGDQPLLDVRFPDVSKHGQGLHISSYNDQTVCWRKLTLWHVLETEGMQQVRRELPKIRTLNVSSKNYEQTYCILKSSWDSYSPTLSVHHDVLFRFGSWCYAGRVQLTPSLSLADIPFVIPALRMQQSRLDFLCDVSAVPTTSPFAPGLEYIQRVAPLIDDQVAGSEEALQSLIARLTNMGLGESVTKWLEGDPSNSFFEFKIEPDAELTERLKNMELIVSKCYHSSGIISMIIVFQFTIYVSVLETNGENPLLDSRFPDVSGKGRGYQLQACNSGTDDWPSLRKVSIWQTVGALEQEFRDKAAEFAQSKSRIELKLKKTDSNVASDDEEELSSKDVERGGASRRTRSDSEERLESKESAPSSSAALPTRAEDKLSSSHSSPMRPQQVGSDVKSSPFHSPAAAPESNAINSPSGILEPLRNVRLAQQALPHHIPKMDALSRKMDDIRKTMGDEGLRAPWDSKGRPLGAIVSDHTARK